MPLIIFLGKIQFKMAKAKIVKKESIENSILGDQKYLEYFIFSLKFKKTLF